MAKKSIDIIISTVLKKTGIDAAGAALKSLSARAASFGKAVGANFMNIKAGFDMAASAVRTFAAAMSKGMKFESMTTQFKTLVGSMDVARAHMKDLQDLGRTPPFDLESFAAASREMLKMTNGVAGFKKEMEIVGDMAAATGSDIRSIAHAFGLAYQSIRDGQGFGRAGSQLVQLGILTKKQVEYFDELSKSGKNNAEVWNKLSEVFNRYKGAMAETEKTTKGVVDAIQGEANVALTEFSKALTDAARPALDGLLGLLRRINEDGTIEEWADRSVEAISDLTRNFRELRDSMREVGDRAPTDVFDKSRGARGNLKTFFGNAWAELGAIGAGLFNSGSFLDNYTAYMALNGYGSTADANAREYARRNGLGDVDIRDAEARDRAEERERVKTEKAKKRAEENAKVEADAQKCMEEDLARAQEERDRKAAEKKAKEAADFAKKKAEIERDAADKIDDIENGDNERLDLEDAYGRVEDARKFVASAANDEELNAAKKQLDVALSNLGKQKRLQEKMIDDEKRKRENAEREILNQKAENLRKLYEQQMAALDAEKGKIDEQVAKLKEMGASNPMQMAKTLNQGAMLREERQGKIDEARFEKARKALDARMKRAGITDINDPNQIAKLGRLGNLDRATLERMRLDKAQKDAKDLEQRKIKLAENTNKRLDDIAKQLTAVGL